jgi:hypothetical protein
MQIISLVPAPLEDSAELDMAYLKSVQALAAEAVWEDEQCQQLAPQDEAQAATLANLINDGNDGEVRLCAVLAAGAQSQSTLGRSLWRRAALDFNEARVLGCLLAPDSPAPDALPLLAWIAQDVRRSLPVRAAAVARLLDADCLAAWPMARLMLLAGTAADEKSELANWPRKGRYELPKRMLLLSIQELLERHQQASTDFEPNAAWTQQVEHVAKLDSIMQGLEALPAIAKAESPTSWIVLLEMHKAGSAQAAASFDLFRNQAAAVLTE